MVENGAEVVGDIEQDAGKHIRQLVSEFDLVDMVPQIRVLLNDMGPWVAFDKVVNERIEITDVKLCADQGEARAVEQMTHGQIRSDERPGISTSGSAFSDHATKAA